MEKHLRLLFLLAQRTFYDDNRDELEGQFGFAEFYAYFRLLVLRIL